MTVQKDVTKNIYVGNSSTRTFPFTFECPAEHPEYIKVYLMQDDGTALATSDYQLDMDAKQITYPSSGTALPEGKKLVIMRELPLQQMMNLVNNGPYFAEDIETAFDECVMAMQQIAEKLNRSIIMSVDIDGDAFVNEVPFEAGKSFRIADDGKSIVLTEDPAKVLPLVQGVYAQTQTQAQNAIASAATAAKSESSTKAYMDTTKDLSENVNVFVPSVDADGTLTWTNKAGLANPTAVNIKGAKGEKGDPGAQGIQGVKGDKGDTGEQGLQGIAGTAATIRIGSVYTGEPGTNASVTNSGTSTNAILNFTIPRGNPGSGGGTSIDVDAELSDSSLNPVQNKVIKEALDGKLGKTETAAAALHDGAGNVIVDTYAKKTDISGVVKSVNGTAPDASGNVTITATGGVSTSSANTWMAVQEFYNTKTFRACHTGYFVEGTSDTPGTDTMWYTTNGDFTLNLSNLAMLLGTYESIVFSAYFTADADHTLTISGAGTMTYIGSASDIAISGSGTLLTVWMIKNSNGVVSIVQAHKLGSGT